jgi:hypothetical protein
VSSLAVNVDAQLADEVSTYYADPHGFVLAMYPWGEDGPLRDHTGPDVWQKEFLVWLGQQVRERRFDGTNPVLPIRAAISSGHGIGKSTLVAWVVGWIMSTRPRAKGTVTANSYQQLDTKTWAAITRWMKLCLTAHWFEITSSRLYRKEQRDTWFCAPQSSKEENSEAFAGQHEAGSSSFYIFDEASAIPEGIFVVAEGGLTDGEPMIFMLGNPTRNSGKFYQSCFGTGRDRWNPKVIDARTSKFTNKAQLEEWVTDYGEDSDFVRVRVRGLPPRASELQFIGQDRVWAAQKRPITALPNEPLLVGVDVSDGGKAWNVIRFRRGMDARSINPIRIPGEAVRNDRGMLLAKLADVLEQEYDGQRVEHMFFDSAFGAPYVERLHRMGHHNVTEVRFGATSPDTHQANMRAYMWAGMKDWLSLAAIDEKDQRLETDLTAPGYHIDRQDRLVIESKEDMAKRGVDSPDDGDALALTFAMQIRPRKPMPTPALVTGSWGWT